MSLFDILQTVIAAMHAARPSHPTARRRGGTELGSVAPARILDQPLLVASARRRSTVGPRVITTGVATGVARHAIRLSRMRAGGPQSTISPASASGATSSA